MIKKFDDYIKEDSSTTATMGTTTAASGGAVGSFTQAAGVSISGGDSGTAFSSNSNGMGEIKSAQPSATPGSVWGKDAKDGSGDIGTKGSPAAKKPAYDRGKGKKKDDKQDKLSDTLNNMYVVKFTQFDGVKNVDLAKNVKENVYIPPIMIKCEECHEEVEDTLKNMFGHVYLKHWAKPNIQMKDSEAREMVQRFFHNTKEEK